MLALGDSARTFVEVKRIYAASGFTFLAKQEIDRGMGYSSEEAMADAARSYLTMGDKDNALKTLEREYENRQYFVTTLKVDPFWDSLRSEPRFISLMKKLWPEK